MPTELDRVIDSSRTFINDMVGEEFELKKFSRESVEECIAAFYAMQKHPRPQIIWFENPWQLHYGAGMFGGYRRKQIFVNSFITELSNTTRNLLEQQMGKRETEYILASIQSMIPARSLAMLSRTIDREIEILDRSDDPRPPLLWQSLFRTARAASLDSNAKITYLEYAERVGGNIGWYALNHSTDLECPWENIFDATDPFGLPLGRSRAGFDIWGDFIAPQETPPHIPTPGAEWSHFLRMRMANIMIAQRFIGLKLVDELAEASQILQTLAQRVHTLGCFFDVCFVSDPPLSVSRDADGRFHNLGGPAIKYGGAFELYCWRDTRVTPQAVTGEVNVERIQRETNLEIMRILLERYGIEEFLRDSQAQHIQEDETGVLYKIGTGRTWDEPITLVGVVNSTAEPDGTFKRYFLRVPPNIRTAREGVAWTFNVSADEYAPLVQS